MRLINRLPHLMLVLILIGLASERAEAFPINIAPGNYTGRYFIAGQQYTGTSMVDLAEGSYFVETGASTFLSSPGATSYFSFAVDSSGQVTEVRNSATGAISGAAQASGNTLTFNTTSITIDTGNYTGRYFLSSHNINFSSFTGNQTFFLLPDLVYGIDNGSFIGNATDTSTLYFVVGGNGQVTATSPSTSAQGSGGTVTLANVSVHFDVPQTYTGLYSVGGNSSLSGSSDLVLIPGLLISFATGGQTISFIPNPNGVNPPSFSFNIGGQLITFNLSTAFQVTIDIKPGSSPNSINLGSNGTVPVAVFSSAIFDARTIDPTTVTLASAPVRLKGKGTPMASYQDVNGDGLLDLVINMSTEALQLSQTDTEAVLEGQTTSGRRIRGVDSVRIVP